MDVSGAAEWRREVAWWENQQSFGISTDTPTRTVLPGAATSFDVTVTSQNGFVRPVTLDAVDLPTGIAAAFNPDTVLPTANSTLSVVTDADTPAGMHNLAIIGTAVYDTGCSRQRSITVTLEVEASQPTPTPGSEPITEWVPEAQSALLLVSGLAGLAAYLTSRSAKA
jgi:hypothetical protein